MKIVKEDGVNIMAPENEDELREVVGGLEKIKMKSAMTTVYNLRWESREIAKIVEEIGEELANIDQHDIEYKDCQKSLRYLLDRAVNEKFLSPEILKIIYFVFEFSLTSIIIDNEPVLEKIYDDGQLFTQALGLAIIGEGVLEGVQMVLDKYDENENDSDSEQEEDLEMFDV